MTKKQSPDRKAEILQAATDLMRDHGLQALSFEGIATQSGLSRQLIRYYFTSLDELMVALCDFLANRYREILVKGIVEIDQTNRLQFFLDFFFGLAEDHPMPNDLEVYDCLVAFALGSEPLRSGMCLQYKTLGQVVAHELAITHAELDGHACEELSFVFAAMMHAHWSFVATLGHVPEHGKLMRRSFDRLVQSYLDDPTPVLDTGQPWMRG